MTNNTKIRHGRNSYWDVIDGNTGLIISRNGKPYAYQNKEEKEKHIRSHKTLEKIYDEYFSENYEDTDTKE